MTKRNLKKHPSGFFIDVDAHEAWIASLELNENDSKIWPAGIYRGLALLKIGRYHGVLGSTGRIDSTSHAPIWVQNQKCHSDNCAILFQVHVPNSHIDGKLLEHNCFFVDGHKKAEFIPEQFLVSPARLALEAYAARINGGER